MTPLDAAISFIISYAAGLLMPEPTVKKSLEKCYKKALEDWNAPVETKNLMEDEMDKYLPKLKSYIDNPAAGVHPFMKEFLRIWVEKIKNNPVCLDYIHQHQTEMMGFKIEEHYQQFLSEFSTIQTKLDSGLEIVNENSEKLDSFLDALHDQTAKQSSILDKINNLAATVNARSESKISQLLPVIAENVEKLCVTSASSFIQSAIEILCKERNLDYNTLPKLHYLNGQCMRFADNALCLDELQKAYEMSQQSDTVDLDVLGGECYVLVKKGDINGALELASQIQVRDSSRAWAWIPMMGRGTDNDVAKIPDYVKRDKTFIGECLLSGIDTPIKHGLINDDVEIVTPDRLTLSNIPVWLVYLTVAFNRFLHSWNYTQYAAHRHNDEVVFHNLASKYFELLGKTQVANLLPELELYFEYTSFRADHRVEHIDALDLKEAAPDSLPILTLMKANMLNEVGKTQDAYLLLDSFPTDGINIDSILNAQLGVSMDLNDLDKVKHTYEKAAGSNSSLNFRNMPLFSTLLPIVGKNMGEIPQGITFSDADTTTVYHLLSRFYGNGSVDVNVLKTCQDKADIVLKTLIADVYAKNGLLNDAIALIEECVDENTYDFRLNIYINILSMDKVNHPKLHGILKSLRSKGIHEIQWLYEEYRMSFAIGAYDEAVKPAKIMYESNASDNGSFICYLQVLSELGDKESIEKVATPQRLQSLTEDKEIDAVFRVLLKSLGAESALSFLCTQISATNRLSLKVLLLQHSLIPEVAALIDKELDIVRKGDYIYYKEGGESKGAFVEDESVLIDFIGKKAGDKITIHKMTGDVTLEILAIHTPAFGYKSEVFKHSESGNIAGLEMFRIDDTGNNGITMEQFLKVITPTDEEVNSREVTIEEYAKGDTSLAALNTNEYLTLGMSDLLLGDTKIYNINAIDCITTLMENGFTLSKYEPVLDMSSLIVAKYLHTSCNLGTTRKYIVPQGLYNFIKDEISKVKTSFMRGKTKELEGVVEWADANCSIEKSDGILKLDLNSMTTPYCRLFAESLMLTEGKDRVLLTDDVGMLKRFMTMCRISSTEAYLLSIFPEEQGNIGDMLAKSHHIGSSISHVFIRQNCLDDSTAYADEITETIQRNTYLYQEVLEACFYYIGEHLDDKETDLKKSMRKCIALISTMIKNWPKESAGQMYKDTIATNNTEPFISCVRIAVENHK